MNTSRIYCSGLWLGFDNAKRSNDHYMKVLPKSLDLIPESSLTFYSDDLQTIAMVQSLCSERGIALTPELVEVEELPGWAISKELVDASARMKLDRVPRPPKGAQLPSQPREKGFIHYWRDLKKSKPRNYRRILAIWMSKVELAAALSQKSPENALTIWIDASVGRFAKRNKRWDFHTYSFPPEKIAHYKSSMTYYGHTLPLNASVLGGDRRAWSEITRIFRDVSRKATQTAYGHDEETILGMCLWKRPGLFHCINPGNPDLTGPV